MSTSIPSTNAPLANLLFDNPGADIIIRSHDSYNFRVPKIYIINSSPILGELIQTTLDSPSNANARASLPLVQLPEIGKILNCLITFIFPVTPILLPTSEEIMELLSVAQKYQMGSVLTRVRDRIARYHPLPTSLEPALRIYSLAQKYGLRPEALQTARVVFLKQSMTIEDLDEKLGIMPGAPLYELWKYHERVQANLASDLTELRASGAHGTLTRVRCTELSSSQIPSWLDLYIGSIEEEHHLFDLVEFNATMARHIANKVFNCECASIPSDTIREFWEALASVIDGCFENAKSALSLVHEREDSEAQVDTTTSPSETLVVSDANLIIRSSDHVIFRVHKSVLAMASPFFKDLLSLPQPSDSESVDGLPVVELSEGSELLNSLISVLYPVPTVVPDSYEKVLYLLAACQKYDMVSVQSFIRAKIKLGEFPAPKGAEAFRAYAIASSKGLVPEMEYAAGQSLDHPMTFEALGEGLRLFGGWALRDLASFRKRCRDNYIECLDTFIEVQLSGPWVGCPKLVSGLPSPEPKLSMWLKKLLLRNQRELKSQKFTHPLDVYSRIHQEFFTAAFQNHGNCKFCLGVHTAFCADLEKKLAEAREKESRIFYCDDAGI